ncbi:protealysin inhibitor emfourin [Pseudomonas sp. dw_358]|uniref:protealysin inhibitor emfourin n=1 Tax=Pseudomonas sp. dw_358 TaxID=2720083 RepID=UPI001BD428C0|nr:protealysin inhibitor emfourin [Pseudomonas sp. dw_358]
MEPLNALHADTVLEVAHEGGVAYVPKLNAPRRIELAHLNDEARQHICELINRLLPFSVQPETAGSGDQRYFRLEVRGAQSLVLTIPEAKVPTGLVELWRGGQ